MSNRTTSTVRALNAPANTYTAAVPHTVPPVRAPTCVAWSRPTKAAPRTGTGRETESWPDRLSALLPSGTAKPPSAPRLRHPPFVPASVYPVLPHPARKVAAPATTPQKLCRRSPTPAPAAQPARSVPESESPTQSHRCPAARGGPQISAHAYPPARPRRTAHSPLRRMLTPAPGRPARPTAVPLPSPPALPLCPGSTASTHSGYTTARRQRHQSRASNTCDISSPQASNYSVSSSLVIIEMTPSW